jgi:GNAT superfamily N-acetyltransferase
MTDDIIIRPASRADAERIAVIHVASWQATYRGAMPDSFLESLSFDQRLPMWEGVISSPHSEVRVWVAVLAGDIVGFCSVGPTADSATTCDLHTIYLQPGMERRGIGRALLSHAEQEVASTGHSLARLWVLEENVSARRFYETGGWIQDDAERSEEIWGQAVREVRYSKRLTPESSAAAG